MFGTRWLSLSGVCLLLLFVDGCVKWYTSSYIAPMRWYAVAYPYGGVPVFQNWFGIDFSLNYVSNTGAAWGLFAKHQPVLLWVRLALVVGLGMYLFFSTMELSKRVGLSLVLTGAVGNIIDFFLYGHVVDMFHFVLWGYSFPVFNIADSLIFCGIMILVLQNIFPRNKVAS